MLTANRPHLTSATTPGTVAQTRTRKEIHARHSL